MHEAVLDAPEAEESVGVGFTPFAIVALTAVCAVLFGAGAQALASSALWGGALLLIGHGAVRGRLDDVAIVLVAIFNTASIFQAGIEVGYRAWFYLAAIVGLGLAALRPGAALRDGWGWLLLAGGVAAFHLLFARTEFARSYGFQQAVNVFAAFGLTGVVRLAARQVTPEQFTSRLALTVMLCAAASLWAPAHLGVSDELVERRLGFGLDIDPNGLGVTGAVCILSALVVAQYFADWSIRLLAIGASLFAAYVMLMTGSRQAMAIVVTGLTVWLALYSASRQEGGGGRLLLVALVLGGAWLTTQLAVFDVTASRFESLLSGRKSIDRLDHWRVAAAIALDYPFGAGSGGFISHFREYAQKLDIRTPYALMRPHNFFALTVGDWGILAFAAVLLWLSALRRGVLQAVDSRRRTVAAVGLAAAVVAMLASTLLSTFLLSLVAANSARDDQS